MPVANGAALKASATAPVEKVYWRGYGWRGPGWGWGAAGAVVGGAIVGSAIANSYYGPRYYYGGPGPYYGGPGPYYYGPYQPAYAPGPAPGDAVAYCMQRFKSYDPRSGTYLGYDGLRHPCP